MTAFVLIAAALVAIAAAALIVPLAGRSRTGAAPARGAALAVILLLAGGGAALYAWLGNRSWTHTTEANTPQAMVGRLARRLEEQPNDLNGWLLLGRSYAALEEFPLAARAYQQADKLSGGKNVEAITGLAEALAFDDQEQLSGRAGQLFERALTIDPQSPKALFYGAAVAERRGDLKLARARFQALLDQSPPEQVRPILERQIASLDARMAGGDGAGGSASGAAAAQSAAGAAPAAAGAAGPPGAGGSGQGGPPGATAAAATVKGPVVRVHVTLNPKVAGKAPQGAPTFVFIRMPDTPGPPLAARRIETRFPQTIELSQADAMIQGHGIEPNQDVEVIARISASGTPQAHSGDLFGRARVHIGGATDANIDIDQFSP